MGVCASANVPLKGVGVVSNSNFGASLLPRSFRNRQPTQVFRSRRKEHSFGSAGVHLTLLSAPPAALLGLAKLESISFHLLNPAGPARLRESRTALNNVRDRERQGGRVVLLRACLASRCRAKQEIEDSKDSIKPNVKKENQSKYQLWQDL